LPGKTGIRISVVCLIVRYASPLRGAVFSLREKRSIDFQGCIKHRGSCREASFRSARSRSPCTNLIQLPVLNPPYEFGSSIGFLLGGGRHCAPAFLARYAWRAARRNTLVQKGWTEARMQILIQFSSRFNLVFRSSTHL